MNKDLFQPKQEDYRKVEGVLPPSISLYKEFFLKERGFVIPIRQIEIVIKSKFE